MEKSSPGPSHIAARSSNSHRSTSAPSAAVAALSSTVILGKPNRLLASQGGTKLRRLVADRKYFGLEASALRAGAERSLAHMSTQPPEQARIDVRNLGEAFHLDAPASWELLSALLMGGLLYPDGSGGYLPTRHFRDYALACVVAPLSRTRAKALIDRACGLAARVNADWVGNPLQIWTRGSVRQLHESSRSAVGTFAMADPASAPRRAVAACSIFAEQRRRVTPDPGGDECTQFLHGRPHRRRQASRATSVQCGVPGPGSRDGLFRTAAGAIPRLERVDHSTAGLEMSQGYGWRPISDAQYDFRATKSIRYDHAGRDRKVRKRHSHVFNANGQPGRRPRPSFESHGHSSPTSRTNPAIAIRARCSGCIWSGCTRRRLLGRPRDSSTCVRL